MTLRVNNNSLQAISFGNVVSNTIGTRSLSLDAVDSAGVELSALNGVPDLLLAVEDAGLYIVNRQRNEANNPAFQLGPQVSSFVQGNEITATVNGGILGIALSTVELSGNAIGGVATGNAASNSIGINADGVEPGVTAEAAAGILNRQGNSGNIEADVDAGNTIEATLLASTGSLDSVTVDVNQNALAASARGNAATNSIVAKADTELSGSNGGFSGAVIGTAAVSATAIAAIDTDTATLDSTADSAVRGNLAILSVQRNYGISASVRNLINSEVEDASIGLTVAPAATNTTLSLSGNRVTSDASANSAGNGIGIQPGTGGPAFASILNNQSVSRTDVTSAAADTEVVLNASSFSGGSIAVNENSVLATGALNQATNTVLAQTSVGGLPGATIVNYQTAEDSSVSAANTGTVIAQTAGGIAGVGDSSVSLSGNQVGAAATINHAVNTIGSPGQVFTRTSSF